MTNVKIALTPDGRVRRDEAARFLGLSAKTLANWAGRGIGPTSIKVGGRRFYRLSDLEAFVAAGVRPGVREGALR